MANNDAHGDVQTGSLAWERVAMGVACEELGAYLERIVKLPLLKQVREQSLALLHLAPGMRALDIGCGNGVFLPVLAGAVGAAGTVEGIDHSPQFVATARKRAEAEGVGAQVTVTEASAYALPFPDATFDAAHCERVLMHLDDPDAALREMRRVVKRGGWVFAAEPDWAGFQVDHPDREAMDLLLHWHTRITFKQPRMGLELNRRMHEVGLVQRQIVPLMDYGMRYEHVTRAGFSPEPAAEALIAAGKLSRERVEATLAYLVRAGEAESYYGFIGMFVGAGRVP